MFSFLQIVSLQIMKYFIRIKYEIQKLIKYTCIIYVEYSSQIFKYYLHFDNIY